MAGVCFRRPPLPTAQKPVPSVFPVFEPRSVPTAAGAENDDPPGVIVLIILRAVV